jgi:hypothetical protein
MPDLDARRDIASGGLVIAGMAAALATLGLAVTGSWWSAVSAVVAGGCLIGAMAVPGGAEFDDDGLPMAEVDDA